MLTVICFKKCKINKFMIGETYSNLNKERFKQRNRGFLNNTEVEELHIPSTKYGWNNGGRMWLLNSHITMFTNLYIEFQRACNMYCAFCRNYGLNETNFEFDMIVKKTKEIANHLTSIVIGGGEPTLYYALLEKFFENIKKIERLNGKVAIITNGSASFEEYNHLINKYRANFYFSRHSIDDKENKKIFGDAENKIMTIEDLEKIDQKRKQVLCCTCFKGGVDTTDKMLEYMKFSAYLGIMGVLFQNLHKDDGFNESINIDDCIIYETLEKLKSTGSYIISKPIYSNSDYVLYIAKNGDFRISFKIYSKHRELKEKWLTAEKRCYDMSLDPSGELHETWRQQDDIVKLIKT